MMDKSEPTLVPQWLRSNGSVHGNGNSSNPSSPSSLRSDDQAMSNGVRKNPLSTNDQNLGRSSAVERIKSSYFRRGSSNYGSSNLRTFNSFSRNQHDRDWDDNNKDRPSSGDFRRRDYTDSLGTDLASRVERKSLRRSHSMISDQRGEIWPRKVETGSKNAYKINHNNANRAPENGLLHKVSFERDFPSLGVEEKLTASEIRRVPSPGLSSSIHSFPVTAPAMMGSDKWTSALAEVPGIVKCHDIGVSSAKVAEPGLPTMAANISTSLSMAETVVQGPPRVQTNTQLSTESQRQELAIKQSRQLIPVTPSLPKALVSNPAEKLKAKTGQPHLPHFSHGGSVKPDPSKTSNIGKLQVLKPVRERNGAVSLPAMDPTSDVKPISSVPAATHSVAGSSSVRAQVKSSGQPVAERKHVLPLLEKRPISQSQTKSRNDFFSLMRKKSVSSSSTDAESGPVISPSDKKPGEGEGEGEGKDETSPVTNQGAEVGVLSNVHITNSSENRNVKVSDGDSCNGHESLNSKKNGSCKSSLFSEEEEAAFLRSLGWEENTEEGGLTEEEINAFYKDVTKYINSKPSWKILQGMPRFLFALESQIGSVAGISSGLQSKLES